MVINYILNFQVVILFYINHHVDLPYLLNCFECGLQHYNLWISVTARLCLLLSTQAFNEGFMILQLSPAVNNALLGSGDQDLSLLTSNRADFQRNLQINKVD